MAAIEGKLVGFTTAIPFSEGVRLIATLWIAVLLRKVTFVVELVPGNIVAASFVTDQLMVGVVEACIRGVDLVAAPVETGRELCTACNNQTPPPATSRTITTIQGDVLRIRPRLLTLLNE